MPLEATFVLQLVLNVWITKIWHHIYISPQNFCHPNWALRIFQSVPNKRIQRRNCISISQDSCYPNWVLTTTRRGDLFQQADRHSTQITQPTIESNIKDKYEKPCKCSMSSLDSKVALVQPRLICHFAKRSQLYSQHPFQDLNLFKKQQECPKGSIVAVYTESLLRFQPPLRFPKKPRKPKEEKNWPNKNKQHYKEKVRKIEYKLD